MQSSTFTLMHVAGTHSSYPSSCANISNNSEGPIAASSQLFSISKAVYTIEENWILRTSTIPIESISFECSLRFLRFISMYRGSF